MAVADSSKHDHNRLDPQGPTKTDQPAPVFFPALHQHRRVSHSNHFYLPLIPFPFYPHLCPAVPWSSFYLMARPTRTGRDRKVQPPRPPNAWILYRSYQFKNIRITHANERFSQATVSKMISDMWRHETEDVKRHFEQEAETMKAKHQELYPDYRFCPKRKVSKLSRKKSKCRDATLSDVDDDDDDVPPAIPVPPSIPSLPQPQTLLIPGYHPNVLMPQPFMIPYLPQVHYGPGGPSPSISAVSSRSPSESPLQPRSVASSSSSSSTRASPSSGSQASSSSLQLPANSPSFPNSHHPSPNPYATLPLSTLVYENSTPGEQPLASPRLYRRSAENTAAPPPPVWDNISTYLPNPDSQNSEVLNFDIPITQTQDFAEFQQGISSNTSFDSLQGLLPGSDEDRLFNLANIESSGLLSPPQGDFEVTMCPLPSPVDYSEALFANVDFDELQRQMESLREGDSSSAPVASHPAQDLQSLFHIPNNPELQAYAAAQQRQLSAYTQDMMNFFNFEAAEDPTEDAPSVFPESLQIAAGMPIFTPANASGSSYVPPAGAMYSSTRRVGGSWKPSFVDPLSQVDEPVHSWAL
ncbi:hypothetical protein L210DRAFT_2087690 [Boletus edulis BED1]|uniref:HMG box domain-containing protein n=1 Tax=Boletus edulis BED1 TaxID=1328754 RepID=A0AAD4GG36_BOLED|nr:hypothetical protein L210DRAFT_2087690 [Boletus edulis BED1]